jgi:transglutaminase-like putative cysteine protease
MPGAFPLDPTEPAMTIQIDVHLDYFVPQPSNLLLQIEAAAMADQRLVNTSLSVSSARELGVVEGEESIGQRTWAEAEGAFLVDYSCTVEIDRSMPDLRQLRADDPRQLPALVIPYLMPSRYCESDEFESFVQREFAGFGGGAKVMAMIDWIASNIDYASGVSDVDTTAVHSFVQRRGVCRDFAHLLASFARAATIPARLVSAYAPGVDPPDFHAVVEVWLEGSWHLLDPTGMARPEDIVRIGVGRDATDIAFMTVFGQAVMNSQTVSVTRIG